MIVQNVGIPIGDSEKVSGIVCRPGKLAEEGLMGLIVAHGAANDMKEPTIVRVCEGLARHGLVTLRFNFPYREKGKKSPDPQEKLERAWKSTYQFFTESMPFQFSKVIISGKSMGGRVASQLVSAGKIAVDGLILLGYPLHAPGKKDKLRDSHLYDITIPLLFVEGSRDALCDLTLLKPVLNKLKAPWRLITIEGGDHSFRVPKSAAVSAEEVYERILTKCAEWVRSTFFK